MIYESHVNVQCKHRMWFELSEEFKGGETLKVQAVRKETTAWLFCTLWSVAAFLSCPAGSSDLVFLWVWIEHLIKRLPIYVNMFPIWILQLKFSWRSSVCFFETGRLWVALPGWSISHYLWQFGSKTINVKMWHHWCWLFLNKWVSYFNCDWSHIVWTVCSCVFRASIKSKCCLFLTEEICKSNLTTSCWSTQAVRPEGFRYKTDVYVFCLISSLNALTELQTDKEKLNVVMRRFCKEAQVNVFLSHCLSMSARPKQKHYTVCICYVLYL